MSKPNDPDLTRPHTGIPYSNALSGWSRPLNIEQQQLAVLNRIHDVLVDIQEGILELLEAKPLTTEPKVRKVRKGYK